MHYLPITFDYIVQSSIELIVLLIYNSWLCTCSVVSTKLTPFYVSLLPTCWCQDVLIIQCIDCTCMFACCSPCLCVYLQLLSMCACLLTCMCLCVCLQLFSIVVNKNRRLEMVNCLYWSYPTWTHAIQSYPFVGPSNWICWKPSSLNLDIINTHSLSSFITVTCR